MSRYHSTSQLSKEIDPLNEITLILTQQLCTEPYLKSVPNVAHRKPEKLAFNYIPEVVKEFLWTENQDCGLETTFDMIRKPSKQNASMAIFFFLVDLLYEYFRRLSDCVQMWVRKKEEMILLNSEDKKNNLSNGVCISGTLVIRPTFCTTMWDGQCQGVVCFFRNGWGGKGENEH